MSDEIPAQPADHRANGLGARSCLLMATLLAGLVIVGAFFVVQRISKFKKGLPPEVTRAVFDEAWDRWEADAPANYSIEIDVVGPRAATYAVEVRDNVATKATRNGDPLPAVPRTMRTWSVPGMFDTMEHDVMSIEKPGPKSLTLRAEFDADTGLPRKFSRQDRKNNFDSGWTVTKFVTTVDDADPTTEPTANTEQIPSGDPAPTTGEE